MLISYTTPRAVARIPVSEHRISVSVVTATYNERPNIGPLYRAVREALEPAWDFELIVVDDNSPDGTSEEVADLAEKDHRVRLISRPGKLGLASALADGFRAAKGDCWVMMDADLSHHPRGHPSAAGSPGAGASRHRLPLCKIRRHGGLAHTPTLGQQAGVGVGQNFGRAACQRPHFWIRSLPAGLDDRDDAPP